MVMSVMMPDFFGGGASSANVSGVTFQKVRDAISELRAAVEGAISKDQAEDSSTRLSRFLKDPIHYLFVIHTFQNQANALVSEIRASVNAIESSVEADFGRAEDAPERLSTDADAWVGRKMQADEIKKQVENARAAASGWEAASRDHYWKACDVQTAAIDELVGVMISAGKACEVGETLNRAIFHVVADAIKWAAGDIRVDHPASESSFYVRSTYARGHLEALKGVLTEMVKWVADVPAQELVSQLTNTLDMTAVITEGSWPSGGSAAGVAPADTASGVDPHTEADLTLPPEPIGSCYAGVRW